MSIHFEAFSFASSLRERITVKGIRLDSKGLILKKLKSFIQIWSSSLSNSKSQTIVYLGNEIGDGDELAGIRIPHPVSLRQWLRKVGKKTDSCRSTFILNQFKLKCIHSRGRRISFPTKKGNLRFYCENGTREWKCFCMPHWILPKLVHLELGETFGTEKSGRNEKAKITNRSFEHLPILWFCDGLS